MSKCPKSGVGGRGAGSVWDQGEGFVTKSLANENAGGHSKIGAEARKRKTRSRSQGSFRGTEHRYEEGTKMMIGSGEQEGSAGWLWVRRRHPAGAHNRL